MFFLKMHVRSKSNEFAETSKPFETAKLPNNNKKIPSSYSQKQTKQRFKWLELNSLGDYESLIYVFTLNFIDDKSVFNTIFRINFL